MPSTSDSVALAFGCIFGGIAATIAAVALGSAVAMSPLALFGAATVSGGLVGTALGRWLVSDADARSFVNDRRLVVASGLGLLALLAVTVLADLRSVGEIEPFWTGLGGVAIAVVGWVAVLQIGQSSESATALDSSDEVVALPEDDPLPGFGGFVPGLGRFRWVLTSLVVAAVAALAWAAWIEREPVLLVFAVPGLSFVLFPLSPGRTRATDEGLVFEQTLWSTTSLGTKLVEWEHFRGYRLDDDALTIVYDSRWSDLVYDRDRIDDLDRATELLDRHLPRLSE